MASKINSAPFLDGDFSSAHFDDRRPLDLIWRMIVERLEAVGEGIDRETFAASRTPSLDGIRAAAKAVEDCCSHFVNTDYDYSLSFWSDFPRMWSVSDIRASDHPLDRFPPRGVTEGTPGVLALYQAILGDMFHWLKKCQLIMSPKVVYGRYHYLENSGTADSPDFRWVSSSVSPPETIGLSDDVYSLEVGVDLLRVRYYSGSVDTRTRDLTRGSFFSSIAASNGYHRAVSFFPVWRYHGDAYTLLGYPVEDIGGDGTRAAAPGSVSRDNLEWLMGRWDFGIPSVSLSVARYISLAVDSSLLSPSATPGSFVSIAGDKEPLLLHSPDWQKQRVITGRTYQMSDKTWEEENMAGPGDRATIRTQTTIRRQCSAACSVLVLAPGPELSRSVSIPANSSAVVVSDPESLPVVTLPAAPDTQPTPSDDYPLAGFAFSSLKSEGPYSVRIVGNVTDLFSVPSYPLQAPFA